MNIKKIKLLFLAFNMVFCMQEPTMLDLLRELQRTNPDLSREPQGTTLDLLREPQGTDVNTQAKIITLIIQRLVKMKKEYDKAEGEEKKNKGRELLEALEEGVLEEGKVLIETIINMFQKELRSNRIDRNLLQEINILLSEDDNAEEMQMDDKQENADKKKNVIGFLPLQKLGQNPKELSLLSLVASIIPEESKVPPSENSPPSRRGNLLESGILISIDTKGVCHLISNPPLKLGSGSRPESELPLPPPLFSPRAGAGSGIGAEPRAGAWLETGAGAVGGRGAWSMPEPGSTSHSTSFPPEAVAGPGIGSGTGAAWGRGAWSPPSTLFPPRSGAGPGIGSGAGAGSRLESEPPLPPPLFPPGAGAGVGPTLRQESRARSGAEPGTGVGAGAGSRLDLELGARARAGALVRPTLGQGSRAGAGRGTGSRPEPGSTSHSTSFPPRALGRRGSTLGPEPRSEPGAGAGRGAGLRPEPGSTPPSTSFPPRAGAEPGTRVGAGAEPRSGPESGAESGTGTRLEPQLPPPPFSPTSSLKNQEELEKPPLDAKENSLPPVETQKNPDDKSKNHTLDKSLNNSTRNDSSFFGSIFSFFSHALQSFISLFKKFIWI